MKIIVPLVNPVFDDPRISEEVFLDFCMDSKIYVWNDPARFSDEADRAFSIWVEYGKDSTLMFDVDLDDLEMFARSILNSIEIFRRNYSDLIKEKIQAGEPR